MLLLVLQHGAMLYLLWGEGTHYGNAGQQKTFPADCTHTLCVSCTIPVEMFLEHSAGTIRSSKTGKCLSITFTSLGVERF